MQKSCCRLTIKSESIYTLVASENEAAEELFFCFVCFYQFYLFVYLLVG